MPCPHVPYRHYSTTTHTLLLVLHALALPQTEHPPRPRKRCPRTPPTPRTTTLTPNSNHYPLWTRALLFHVKHYILCHRQQAYHNHLPLLKGLLPLLNVRLLNSG